MELNKILVYEKGKDTRTDADLDLYKINKTLSKEKFVELDKEMKKRGCYYSRFARAFICKTELDLDEQVDEKFISKTHIKYGKSLLDYMKMNEYIDFLKKYAEKNYLNFWRRNTNMPMETKIIAETYFIELLANEEHKKKYGYFGKLDYIREAIIHKSLGLPKEELKTNGNHLYYSAIWDKLPTIEGLYLDKEKSYTAVWGYDQTNVDIAYQLNRRVWGLDIFRDKNGSYYLVRLKNNRFHDKDGVRYFSYDPQPSKTFERDASQTGQYR